jgi:diguanylate cyclase (GGDEF)-like protein/PAS domain S-box-containing protein
MMDYQTGGHSSAWTGLTGLLPTAITAALVAAIVSGLIALALGAYATAAALLLLALICSGVLHWRTRRHEPAINLKDLDLAFGLAPAPMMLIDMEGRIQRINEALLDLLIGCAVIDQSDSDLAGRTLHQVLGDSVWEDLKPERRLFRTGEQNHLKFERDLDLANGQRMLLLIYVHLLRDTSGAPTQALVQLLDLTEQRETRHALAVSESRFRGIIENTGELTFVVNTRGRISYLNRRTAEILGQDRHSLVGTSPLKWIHPDSQHDFIKALRSSLRRNHRSFHLPRIRLTLPHDGFADLQVVGLTHTPGVEGAVITGRLITDKVHTEKQLRASQSRFSTIFHASPDAILILREQDRRIVDFNGGFSRLLGYTREEALNTAAEDLKIWQSEADSQRLLDLLCSEIEVRDFETQLRAKNGELLHTEISIRRIEIDGERCLLCVGRDISQRRQTELALRESEEKFARIFFNSPDGIAIISLQNGRITDINDAMLQSLGYERAEILRKRVQHLPVVVDHTDILSIADLLREKQRVNDVELMLTSKGGEAFPVEVSAVAADINGKPNAICLVRDNRGQRDAELLLKRSEERFRGAFENAPIGMLLLNTEGFVFQANHFAQELLAMDEQDLMGSHISRLVPAEDRPSLKESMSQLLFRSQDVSRSERRMLSRNSIELWTNFHMVIQRNEQGDALYFIVQMADVTEMRQSQERMAQMAFYDTLTDLANRRLFSNRLEQSIQHALRTNQCAALLYLDLDQFKRVNDTLGHEAGDELLREVGHRLTQCVRREDTVARPGGDEFTILLHQITSPADAGRVAEKILDKLREPVTIVGHQLVVTTSIGITIIPDDSVQPNVLTKNADLAMYRAKERGRNNYQYYSEDMNTEALSRLRTENELYIALAEQQFELYYQPKVRLSDQRILGAECLLRWRHPTRGIVMPDQFIRVAEESGAIIEIGNWIIEQACRTASQLVNDYEPDFKLAINISPRQFRDPNLVINIRRYLRESELNPSRIELEITETMLMDDSEASAIIIERLHKLGVGIAIDDFGTGYSSLSYLKRFPIQTIKVDRAFVQDIPENADDRAITSAVIAMAHQLNLDVVAEGVETRAQLDFLRAQDCEYGQGFYFSKPLPLDRMTRLLRPRLKVVQSDEQAG